jgi:membrane protein DedA with SNARE-associated domain/membrane-associated phospholipid phosphatase
LSRLRELLSHRWFRISALLGIAIVAWILYRQFFPELDLEQLLQDFANFLGNWTYLVVGLLAFLETGAFVGLLVPGETMMLVGGAVAGLGVINLYLLLAIAWSMAFLGDTFSFFLGRKLGRSFLLNHGSRLGITPERFGRVEEHFERHGGMTVLVGRFVGVIRAIAPFIAGSSGMRYRAFAPYSILGSGLQVSSNVLVGYFFARSLGVAAEYVGLVAVIIGTAIVVGFGSWWAYRFLRVPENRVRSVEWLESHRFTRPLVELARRFRPQLVFLRDRLTPGGSFGLEFTTLMAVLAVSSFVVVAFTSIFLGDGGPTPGDRTAADIVDALRTGWLIDLAEVFTVLGSGDVLLPLVTLTAVVLIAGRRWSDFFVLLLSTVTIVIGIDVLKDEVARPRPSGGLVGTDSLSFPSGHAAYSVFYTWIAITFAYRIRPGMARSAMVVGAGITVTALVGLSRVYLGVHYLSDVTAGWAFGAFWFAFFAIGALLVTQLRKT